jgi:hypothetical protein
VETKLQQIIPCDTSQEESEEQSPVDAPSGKTPQEFYEEFTRRADVRAILEALAST